MLLLATITMNAQYNKWSIEGQLGLTKIRDVTSVQPFNVDLGARYMFNTKFGAKISANYSNLEDYKWQSASLMGVANVGRLMNFEEFSDWWTILVGVGGNYEYNNSNTNKAIFHRLSNFHLMGNITNEFKLSKKVFLTAGLNVVPGVNSRPTQPAFHYTETTSILNFNVGVNIALGKHKEHADWYLEKPKEGRVDTIYMQPNTINKTEVVKTNVEKEKFVENVFFKHDSFKVDIQGLNAIKKTVSKMQYGQKIVLKGYASNPATNDYNFKLSKKRCLSVQNKLISLGVNPDNIQIESYGEIPTFDSNNEDISRYVQITLE